MKMDKYLTEQEEKTLFKTVDSVAGIWAERDSAWMNLLRQTGMRIGALAGLTVADARHAIATGRLILRAEHAKRHQQHDVPVNKKAKVALKALLKIRVDMGFTAEPNGSLVAGRNHKGLSIRSFQSRMHFWVDASQLDVKASPHWFRHTLAMRIMDNSTAANPLVVVRAALGHKNASSTMVYTQPNREMVALAMEEAS